MATQVEKWVAEMAALAKPDKIYWCDGSEEEARKLIEIGMKEEKIGEHPIFHELNPETFPNCYLHHSHPSDVARTEKSTIVAHPSKEESGPTNNWMEPAEAKAMLTKISNGCMKGKTMYVLPYMMGNPDSPYAKACIQVTDVSYVAVSMRIMTRMGKDVLDKIGDSDDFVKGFHSVINFDPENRYIVHFPQEGLVWSVNSGYGGNALLGKKCFSLRIASWIAEQEGWLAEHMVLLGIEDLEGKITYMVAALPSACGKTNLAMLESTLPGYKIWTLGDDIAWLNIGPDGQLWAINPEAGFFGVAPGTSMKNNPNMMRTLKNNAFLPTLFTNVGLNTDTNEPWWEECDEPMPKNLENWKGNKHDPASGEKAAHPNSRFTVSASQCPVLSPEFNNPKGVPVSAIIFGGKRSTLLPLVFESFNWQNGVFGASRMGSETTAAAMLKVGKLRRDPMAMLPFCGYNMGDYFKHWLGVGKRMPNPPKIFFVNWFRKSKEGKFLWPGFGQNIRVLKWIIDRVNNRVEANKTPIGLVPKVADLDLSGLDISKEDMEELFQVDIKEWKDEIADIKEYFEKFEDRIPKELWDEYKELEKCAKI